MTRRLFLWALPAAAASRPEAALYVGGTIGDLRQEVEGALEVADPKVLRFTAKRGGFEIPYDGVTSLEYGQKAGRRLGLAITLSMWALLSKKRRHYITIGYNDAAGQPQAVVLEIPKGRPRTIIAIVEARAGVKCDYESEEARRHVHG